MNTIALNTTLSDEYKIAVIRNGELEETGWFENLILNQGLDRLGSSSSAISYAQIGTGTAAPNVSDTSLTSFLVGSNITSTATTIINAGSPTYVTGYTYLFTFTAGSVIGNIREVGVGWAASGSTLFSKALITDKDNTPLNLTLTSADQLLVYYKISVAPPNVDAIDTVNITGVDHSYICRTALAGSFGIYASAFSGAFSTPGNMGVYNESAILGSITGQPSGATSTIITAPYQYSYVAGTYYKDVTWTVGTTNFTVPIKVLTFTWLTIYATSPYMFQLMFDAAIPKNNTTIFTITMRFSWNRQ